jgi:hypothetical protein
MTDARTVCPSSDRRYALLRKKVANPLVQSMASNFEEALRLIEAALMNFTGDLWETDLWPDDAPTGPTSHGGRHGSSPWFLAYHALLTLDDDLSAEFEPWKPQRQNGGRSAGFPLGI